MTSGARTNDALGEARRLAREHGFVIAEVSDCINPTSILDKQYRAAWVLYRRRVRLGKRRSAGALLRLLKQTLEADRLVAHADHSSSIP